MKSPYELKANDEDKERGVAPSDDDDRSDDKSDSSSDNSSSDSGHDDDDKSNSDSESNNSEDYDSQYSGNDWGEPPSDKEDEDADIEDDVEANKWSDTASGQYRLINVLEDAREEVGQPNDLDYDDYPIRRPSNCSYITDVSSRSGP